MQALKLGSLLQGGKYRITGLLGQGGFGITYEGEQTGLSRRVAIKEFFMKDYCDRNEATGEVSSGSSGSRDMVAEYRRKFLKEAQLIASMEDVSHVIRIYDIFEENQTAYYVMEFISGGSLKSLVNKSGPLPEPQAIAYIRQVGEALSYLHSQNVLHLDVKPDNVLLNRKGEAVLIDFGVSKHYDKGGSQTSSTPVGLSKGYAPTEQYQQGGVNQFTPATDVYSLGATLYKLLTGKTPPEASIVFEDGLPPRPENISPHTWRAIEQAMQPRRKDRTQTVDLMLEMLNEEVTVTSSVDPEATVVVVDEVEEQVRPEVPKPEPVVEAKAEPVSAPKAKPIVTPHPAPVVVPKPTKSTPVHSKAKPSAPSSPNAILEWALASGLASGLVSLFFALLFFGWYYINSQISLYFHSEAIVGGITIGFLASFALTCLYGKLKGVSSPGMTDYLVSGSLAFGLSLTLLVIALSTDYLVWYWSGKYNVIVYIFFIITTVAFFYAFRLRPESGMTRRLFAILAIAFVVVGESVILYIGLHWTYTIHHLFTFAFLELILSAALLCCNRLSTKSNNTWQWDTIWPVLLISAVTITLAYFANVAQLIESIIPL